MSDMTIDQLRTLIRLIAPLETLVNELEKNTHLEMLSGTSALAKRNYAGIYATVTKILDDEYVKSLTIDEDAKSEREIIVQVMLAGKQLLSHLQTVCGVGVLKSSEIHIQTAPQIIINAQNSSEKTKQDLFDMVRRATKETDDEQ